MLLQLSDEEIKLLEIAIEDQIRSYERQIEKIMKFEEDGYTPKIIQDSQSMVSKYSKIMLRLRGE